MLLYPPRHIPTSFPTKRMACRPTYNRFIEVDENLSAFDIISSSLANCSRRAMFLEELTYSVWCPIFFHFSSIYFFIMAVRVLPEHLMHDFCLMFYINPGDVTLSSFVIKILPELVYYLRLFLLNNVFRCY